MFPLRQRVWRISMLVALVGLLAGALSVSAAPAQQSTNSVYWFPGTPLGGQAIAGSSSKLVRNSSGVSMNLKTSELQAGSVATIWWVVFNYPENCIVAFHCGEPDLFDNNSILTVKPSVMYATGHVIGNNGKGNFGGHLSVGDTAGCYLGPIFPAPAAVVNFPCNPLMNVGGAEIHLAVHDHGAAVPGLISDMLSTFDGGCSNLGRGTGPNLCATIQASPHSVQ